MLAPSPRHFSDLDLGARTGSMGTGRRMMSDEDVWFVAEDAAPSSFVDPLHWEHAATRWARSVVEPFRELRMNWDSYGGSPVDTAAAEIGVRVLTWIAMAELPLPQTFPTADGGLSVEWHGPELDFVISLTPPTGEPPSAYYRTSGEEWEIEDLRVPDGRLDAALSALAGAQHIGS